MLVSRAAVGVAAMLALWSVPCAAPLAAMSDALRKAAPACQQAELFIRQLCHGYEVASIKSAHVCNGGECCSNCQSVHL
jgi:hypothetical protein